MPKIRVIKGEQFDFDVTPLKPKDILIPEFWNSGRLSLEVSKRLNEIANDILNTMSIETKILDIIITGSIASYNWHKLSDIDLHVVLDFKQIDDNLSLVKKMLDQSRINWNKTHNIFIFGKEVELYFQDANEPHESNGIWSLKAKKWLAEPVKLNPDLDLRTAEKKASAMAASIEHIEEIIEKDAEVAYQYASKLKMKISRMRQSGLSEEGIYSPENLAFKMLRNSGFLGKLSKLKIKSYDDKMSLDQEAIQEIKDYFNDHLDDEYMKFDNHPLSNIEKILDDAQGAPWGEIVTI